MKFLIERCKHWDGDSKVCDFDRECCAKRIERLVSKGYQSCFDKPFEIRRLNRKFSPTEIIRHITHPEPPQELF